MIKVFEALTDESYLGGNGHEVGISFPARDEVHMDMVGQTGAGAMVDIDTEVESMGFNSLGEGFLGLAGKQQHLEQSCFVELVQIADVGRGGNEQMAAGVGKAIEHHQAKRSAPKDEVFLIMVGVGPIFAEETAFGFAGRMVFLQ